MGICAEPGCPEFAVEHGRCRAHRRLVTGTGSRPGITGAKRQRILKRDGNRCTWIEDGRRCEERKALHIGHVIPVTLGGTDADSNLRVMCATHNLKLGGRVASKLIAR